MAFEELKENTQQIQEETKAYIESSIHYYKLWGFQFAMKSTLIIARFLLLGFFLMLALLFGSLAAAFAIGDAIGSTSLGFLIVAGFYFVLILLIYFLRLRFVEKQVLQKFSDLFFNNQ